MMTNRQPPLCLLLVLAGYLYAGGGAFQAVHAQEAAGETPLFCIPTPTGELLENEQLKEWNNGSPAKWRWNPRKGGKLVRTQGEAEARLALSPPTSGSADFTQTIVEPILRPGDYVLVQAEVRGAAPGDAILLLRLYSRDRLQDVEIDGKNTRRRGWERVSCMALVRTSDLASMVVGVRVRAGASAPVEVRSISAWVIPPVP